MLMSSPRCGENAAIKGKLQGVAHRATKRAGSRSIESMRWLRLAFLLPLVLAACGRVTDSEQLRLCRPIPPALHPEGTEIREIRIGLATVGRSGVRIDYAAREPGAANKMHFVSCGF